MRALSLDFRRSGRPRPWLGAVLLAAGVAAAGHPVLRYRQLTETGLEWQARVERLERTLAKTRPGYRKIAHDARGDPALQREIRQANGVVDQLAWPWESLFRAVESAGTEQVALLAIRPDPHKGSVAIRGEARSLYAMLDYLRRLEAQRVFSRVLLQQHAVQQQDREQPVRFDLTAAMAGPP